MRFEIVEVVGKVYRLNENGSLELIGEVISPEVIISEYGEDDEKREEAR